MLHKILWELIYIFLFFLQPYTFGVNSWEVSSFTCSFCNKVFGQSIDLQRHERVHTGERPYSCSYCPYKAKRKHHLDGHTYRIHKISPEKISHQFSK